MIFPLSLGKGGRMERQHGGEEEEEEYESMSFEEKFCMWKYGSSVSYTLCTYVPCNNCVDNTKIWHNPSIPLNKIIFVGSLLYQGERKGLRTSPNVALAGSVYMYSPLDCEMEWSWCTCEDSHVWTKMEEMMVGTTQHETRLVVTLNVNLWTFLMGVVSLCLQFFQVWLEFPHLLG